MSVPLSLRIYLVVSSLVYSESGFDHPNLEASGAGFFFQVLARVHMIVVVSNPPWSKRRK